jgi:glyoxylase I family protein
MSKFNFFLHHTSLVVSNTEQSLKFYCGVLGLDQTERPELPFPGAWLQIGAQQIHLLELENPDPILGRPEHGGRDRHVALCVDELGPVKAALDESQILYTVSKSGRQALFCRDYDGNTIEVLEQF